MPEPGHHEAAPARSPGSSAPSDDPCADPVGLQRRALCGADSHDGGCVGFACERTRSRTAIECMLERGDPDASFVALSRAENPATRMYAREALLRRDAMTLALIAEGLTDPATVTTESGCIVDRAALTEPAFVALLQRHGAEADALLAGFLGSTLGRELLFETGGSPMLDLAWFAVRDPERGASVRAMRAVLEHELAVRLESQTEPGRLTRIPEPLDPAEALSRWTHAYGCDPARPPGTATAAEEAAEVERLLLLERELAAQSP